MEWLMQTIVLFTGMYGIILGHKMLEINDEDQIRCSFWIVRIEWTFFFFFCVRKLNVLIDKKRRSRK
jgi:hypothetical protein